MLTNRERIEHMIETTNILLQFATNISKDDYLKSVEKQYAVKFAIVMLGEDAALISDDIKNNFPNIPWHQIKCMRNTVAHDYRKTDEEIIWDTVVTDIHPLRQQLIELKLKL